MLFGVLGHGSHSKKDFSGKMIGLDIKLSSSVGENGNGTV